MNKRDARKIPFFLPISVTLPTHLEIRVSYKMCRWLIIILCYVRSCVRLDIWHRKRCLKRQHHLAYCTYHLATLPVGMVRQMASGKVSIRSCRSFPGEQRQEGVWSEGNCANALVHSECRKEKRMLSNLNWKRKYALQKYSWRGSNNSRENKHEYVKILIFLCRRI